MEKQDPTELIERVEKMLREMSDIEFLPLINQILGTSYTQEDIDWFCERTIE